MPDKPTSIPPPPGDEFRFDEPRQREIHRRLSLIGPGPAAFYRDACRILGSYPPFEASTHFVGHALREIESALRDVFEPIVRMPKEKTKKSGRDDANHAEEIRAILRGLAIEESDPIASAWLAIAGKKNERGLHSYAHRNGLEPPRPLDRDFHETWHRMEEILYAITGNMEECFFGYLGVLDQLANKKLPDESDIEFLKNNVPNNLVTRRRFFDQLQSAEWLQPLRTGGFFKQPPGVISVETDEGTALRLPPWPESAYLARMAIKAPDLVRDIILEMEPTENSYVHQDLAEAALEMPPSVAVGVIPVAKTWTSSLRFPGFPQTLGELVSHLARGGQVESALDLAASLLEVIPGDTRPEIPLPENATETERKLHDISILPPESQTRFDDWYYSEILKKNIPDLIDHAGEKALRLLCGELDRALSFEHRATESNQPYDSSYLWRRAVEDHPADKYHYGVKDHLITAIRDMSERLILERGAWVGRLCSILESYEWPIFTRVSLHLMRVFPESVPGRIEAVLTDRDTLDSPILLHEVVMLLKDQFQHLSEEARSKIIAWATEGPNTEGYIEYLKQRGVSNPDEEVVRSHVERVILARLDHIAQDLPPAERGIYDDLLQKYGEPKHPDIVYDSEGWIGPTSPLSLEEISSKSVEELVDFLRSWQPPHEHWSPTPEGLGRLLRAAVDSRPESYARSATLFIGLSEPTYIRNVLGGLEEAARTERRFEWEAVLDLCEWLLQQQREIPERAMESAMMDHDRDWGPSRGQVADLLSAGCGSASNQIPFAYRDRVWGILEPITDDPDPTPADEARFGGSNMGPASYSINTTRGKAMHAVIRYALWVRHYLEKEHDAEERLRNAFGEMPEVREILDSHVDPSRDPSEAVRAVYGQWFPWLDLLDHQWAASNVHRIFPLDLEFDRFFRAAWETYVTFGDVYDTPADLLIDPYQHAIDLIGWESPFRHVAREQENRLAEHIMVLYLRARTKLGDEGGLVFRFFDHASDELRAHAVSFVGRSVLPTPRSTPTLERLKELWRWRLGAAQESLPNDAKELAAFGSWFAHYGRIDRTDRTDPNWTQLDDEWALSQLKAVLGLAVGVDDERGVVERLALLSILFPLECVNCLRQIVEGDHEGWGYFGWRDAARTILATAIGSPSEAAHAAANALINVLAARGRTEYADLLHESPPRPPLQ